MANPLRILLFTTLFLIIIGAANAANILFFIGFGNYSHKSSIWPIAAALSKRGHNITVLSGTRKQPFQAPLVRDLVSTTLEKALSGFYDVDRFQNRLDGTHPVIGSMDEVSLKGFESMEKISEDKNMQLITYNSDFDVVITNLIFGEFGFAIAHRANAKVILHAPAFLFGFIRDEFGFPDETGSIPDMRAAEYFSAFPLGFWDRVRNFVTPTKWFLSRRLFVYPRFEDAMAKIFGWSREQTPHFPDLIRNTSLILVNSHHSTDFPHSVPPFVISVGGMQCWLPSKPLSKDFQTILDEATDGAVLIAFGSTINPANMPVEIKSKFFVLMRNFPKIKFIWRWDGPEPAEKFENAVFAKWIPQFQILGHKNLKAFISHGGLNSITEATNHGVPLILLPLFADQNYNAFRVEIFELGIRLELTELTTSKLIHAVDQVLYNPIYAENMKAMSGIFKDRSKNPIDTSVFWVEFVLRHEDFACMKPLQNVTWFQRKLWDAFLILILAVSLAIILIIELCAFAKRKWCSRKHQLANGIKKNN